MSDGIFFDGRRLQNTPEQMRRDYGVCLLANEIITDTEYDILTLPDEFFVEPATNDELSTQIAETGGLHTCDMTTTVNAFIWQGWLTGDQGAKIHEYFPTYKPDRKFAERVINGKKVSTTDREEKALQAISGENLYSAATFLDEVSKEEATTRILGTLASGVVLNVGNGDHARLAVGYDRANNSPRLQIADPYHPNDLELKPIEDVVAFHPSTSLFGVARKTESLAYRPDIPY